ncbi:energy transducer TonB [Motiliproteus sp. SC1-56]|uniref:energy transducer TonB n=1 Tax=Motiliproteus sp. SC1-56 TaxID=2799565 RepID=UPI001A8D6D5D|nr:energy transducer TonB [Motiliproteus sp. SC1-56]
MAVQSVSPVRPITPFDRLGFTVFLAIAVHAIVILGLGFKTDTAKPVARTLEVTLAQFESEQAPKEADFLAQHDQVGSGNVAEKTLPSTREVAPFKANQPRDVAPRVQPAPAQEQALEPQPVPAPEPVPEVVEPSPKPPAESRSLRELVVTQSERALSLLSDRANAEAAAARPATGSATSLLARSLEIASLEAKLDLYQQQSAKQPRVRRLYSASTRKAFDAAYLDSWRRKVERIGNLNYPEEARKRELYGHLRLLVVIRPDGSLERVDVLQSSGYKLLDDAARRIVRLAAPFAPFPPELRKHADMVEIIRTWKFERARFGLNS